MNALNKLLATDKNAIVSPVISSKVVEGISNELGTWAQNSLAQQKPLDMVNSFSHLLSQASESGNTTKVSVEKTADNQHNNNINAKETIQPYPANLTPETDPLASMQNGLLSMLGLSALSGDSNTTLLSQLSSASDASLENLQSTLLTNLQSSLFTPLLPKAAPKNTKQLSEGSIATLTNIAATVQEQDSLLTQIGKFSFGNDGLDITDGFDAVNALHHIPFVSTIYRETTGDTLNAVAKLGGGFMYGGTLGLALSAADLAVEYVTGASVGETVSNFDYAELLFGTTNSDSNTKATPSMLEATASSYR